MYCTYEQYQAHGGTLPETQFGIWCPRASREIDRLTLGRAAKYQDKLTDELADACTQIVDLLHAWEDALSSSGGGAVTSATNDGISITYGAMQESNRQRAAQVYSALQSALGADPYGLLYRGICEC